ncbi:Aspartate aminotransferase, cytoplasmic [Exophiala dermatitidis]
MGSFQPSSFFEDGVYVPPDPIFEVTKNYLADQDPKKVNLGQGAYRDENGQPWVLPCVRLAKQALKDQGHEYLPIAGLPTLRQKAVELVFERSKALAEGRIASCQSLSGTGAIHLTGLALRRANPAARTVYITDPTWSNHRLLFSNLGYEVQDLPYYRDGGFDYDGYIAGLREAEPNSIVVLHACAHNPTGYDPSKEQWKEIISVINEKQIFPVIDAAYLGFNSGSVDDDAWVIRYIVDELNLEAAVSLSFAKNMGLYGERVGLVALVAKTPELAVVMDSILANMQRATISSPPVYGARIAATVLGTPEFKAQWASDLKVMSGRIRSMREKLYDELLRLQTPGDWSFIVKQSGMFGYTGLNTNQIKYLQDEHHIYMADTGRISIAGLNDNNVGHFAAAVDKAVRYRH